MNAVVESHLFAHLRRLPALPEALSALLRTLDDENASQQAITLTISRDLNLTCKMLRIANSSFYGLAYQVASVQDALMILGLRTVRSLAIATLLTTQLQKWSGSMSSLRHFFEHALGTAIYSQLLAKYMSIQGDAAFTAGLLHDIGKLALVVEYPSSSQVVFESEEDLIDLRAFAGERYKSFNHAELGQKILEYWHFPVELQEAVRLHHHRVSIQTSDLTAIVVAANILNSHQWDFAERVDRLRADAVLWDRLEINEESLHVLESRYQESFQEILGILQHVDATGEST